MKVLVTGSSGFIGFHVVNTLCNMGIDVCGIDNHNDYYDESLKQARLDYLVSKHSNYKFYKRDLKDIGDIKSVFLANKYDYVIHLAAQVGVRSSISKPLDYINDNIVAFTNLLEVIKNEDIKHFVYASSSSVYGDANLVESAEDHNTSVPQSLYAATKKSAEVIAHAYNRLYHIPMTGLRFFTVYGPWGRPDMALWKFTDKIMHEIPIDVYDYGNHLRDFTYVDDIVDGIIRVLEKPEGTKQMIYNIGNGHPVKLKYFISIIEEELEVSAICNYLPKQKGDVDITNADITKIKLAVGYKPTTTIEAGVKKFIKWYKEYYGY